MSEPTPFWFGPEDRRLFGWLHAPAGGVHAGVVLCPPLGYEYVCAYRTYVLLARRLTEAGFAVLRFDYDGTGDSVGDDQDPARVDAWLASIRAAVEDMRGRGVDELALVGMRAGALLAAVAAETCKVSDLVLWDPATSGRSYLREMQMLHMVGVGVDDQARPEGEIEVAGIVFRAGTTSDLRGLDLAKLERLQADNVLVLSRPERTLPKSVAERLDELATATWIDAVGQEQVVDVVSVQTVVPDRSVNDIVSWLEQRHPAAAGMLADAPFVTSAVVGHAPTGEAIVERPVRLGPLGLFAITTEPEGAPPTPWLVGLNNATDHHIGPNRMWVDLGRRWAGIGHRSVRLDLSGIGDSPARPGQAENRSYAPEAFDDVVEALTALNPDDPHDAVLTGLCSGGYLAVDVGAIFGVRMICAVNPDLRYKPDDVLVGSGDSKNTRTAPPTRRLVRPLSGSHLADRIGHWLPPKVWFALDRLGLHNTPAKGLEVLVAKGTYVLLVYGDDHTYPRLRDRSATVLNQLESSPHFEIAHVPGMDHALMISRHRDRLADLLTDRLLGLAN
jgi:alpha-beta hydrolase superfamily lysophospholipase